MESEADSLVQISEIFELKTACLPKLNIIKSFLGALCINPPKMPSYNLELVYIS